MLRFLFYSGFWNFFYQAVDNQQRYQKDLVNNIFFDQYGIPEPAYLTGVQLNSLVNVSTGSPQVNGFYLCTPNTSPIPEVDNWNCPNDPCQTACQPGSVYPCPSDTSQSCFLCQAGYITFKMTEPNARYEFITFYGTDTLTQRPIPITTTG